MTESSDTTLPVPPPSPSSELTLDVALPFSVVEASPSPSAPPDGSTKEITVVLPRVVQSAEDATANVSLEWLHQAQKDHDAEDEANVATLMPGHLETATSGPAADAIGQIGDYDLLREIARGGMGVVYLARQRRLNRLVALKMILAGQLASSEEVRRFYAEAEAVAKLEHPNIVSIFEVGQYTGQHFYSMGFVDGPSLSKRLQDGPFSSREAAELMLLLAEAMEYAHQNGIIHRDLKPANVLLSIPTGVTAKSGSASALGRSRLSRRSHASGLNKSRGGPERSHFEFIPKITDFGLAKQTTLDGSAATVSGQIMGTPSYMPPEQAAGEISRIGPVSDVYSLGAILYELLTGRPPFRAANVVETLRQVQQSEPVAPRALDPSLDRDLETICLKCLEKDGARRYESAQALADDLARFLNGEAVLARPVSRVVRIWRWCKRKPLVAGSIAAAMIAVISLGLAIEARRSVAAAQQVTKLKDAFEKGLDIVALNPDQLVQLEASIEAISLFDSVAAADARQRLLEKYVSVVDQAIHQARLSDQDREQINSALVALSKRDSQAAERLKSELSKRAGGWDVDIELAAPFEDLSRVFSAGVVEKSLNDQLRPLKQTVPEAKKSNDGTPAVTVGRPFVRSLIGCSGSTRAEVVFGNDWQEADSLSLRFGDEPLLYLFRIEVTGSPKRGDDDGFVSLDTTRTEVQPTTPEKPDEGLPNAEQRNSFRTHREHGASGTMSIWRGNSLLQQFDLDLAKLASDSLRIVAERDGPKLTLQIQNLAPLSFEDLMPLPTSQASTIGFEWPMAVSLRSFRKWRRMLAANPSPLQAADERFATGEVADAESQFAELARSSTSPEIQSEAKYKQAICLLNLSRSDEARPVLENLASTENRRWSTAASCQLWLLHLRAGRTKEADTIFEPLASQNDSRKLATLVPEEVRHEILDRYLREFESAPLLLRHNPNRLGDIERAVALDRMLSNDGLISFRGALILSRAYRFEGQLAQAKDVLSEVLVRAPDDWFRLNYLRVSRELGEVPHALETVHGWDKAGLLNPTLALGTLTERIRCLIASKNWEQAERELDWLMSILRQHTGHLPPLYFMKGFLLEQQGNREAAERVWGEGFDRCWGVVTQTSAVNSFTMHVLAMGSLSGRLSREHMNDVTGFISRAAPQGTLGVAIRTALSPQGLESPIREMWRTPRGHELARNLAYEAMSTSDRMKLPLTLAASEYFRRNSLGDGFDSEQEAASWHFAELLLQGALVTGNLNSAQIAQLGVTWKGSFGLFGWSTLAPTLAADVRSDVAYFMAHRALRLNQPDVAPGLFQTAMKHPDPNSVSAKLAKLDLRLLENKLGVVRIESDAAQPLKIVLEADGQPARELAIDGGEPRTRTELEAPAGNYRILIEPPNESLTLSVAEISVQPLGRHTILVSKKKIDDSPTEPPSTELAPLNTIDYVAERKAAEWVVSVGGALELINAEGQPLGLINGKLPDVPLAVTKVVAVANPQITDAALSNLAGCRRMRWLHLPTNAQLTDACFVHLREMTSLETLDFNGCVKITGDSFASLWRLQRLRTLNAVNTSFSDTALLRFDRLRGIRELSLGASKVTYRGLEQLVKSRLEIELFQIEDFDQHPRLTAKDLKGFSTLREVSLSGRQLDAEGWQVLAELPQLTTIRWSTPINDLQVPGLLRLQHLQRLSIGSIADWDQGLTDDGYRSLAKSAPLNDLNLFGHQGSPSDAALKELAELKSLRKLTLQFQESSRRYSSAGVATFRARRPEVELLVDGQPQ